MHGAIYAAVKGTTAKERTDGRIGAADGRSGAAERDSAYGSRGKKGGDRGIP